MSNDALIGTMFKLKRTFTECKWNPDYEQTIARLDEAIQRLRRVNALSTMSQRNNPYKPLLRIMVRLEIVKDWPI